MSAKTIVKIIFLVIMTICALVSVFASFISNRKNDSGNRNSPAVVNRKVVKLRMICFLIMLISLFICVVI